MNKKQRTGFPVNKSPCYTLHSHAGYTVIGEIWLEKSGRLYLDTKRVTMLNLIDKYGSLAAAARTMRLSYNTVWLWVMAMNRLSGHPLVKRGSGGVNGGYSTLTPQGYKVIAEYNRLNGMLERTMYRLSIREIPAASSPPGDTSGDHMEIVQHA